MAVFASCKKSAPIQTPIQEISPVSVTVAADNPAPNVIVGGQSTADLLHVSFAGTGLVTSMTFERSGVSLNTTLAQVYLYQGINRISNGASIEANGTVTFSALTINVSGPITISARADIAVDTSSTVILTLKKYTVDNKSYNCSISGNTMVIANGNLLATAQVGANTIVASTVFTGSEYSVWAAPLQIKNRAVALKKMVFTILGPITSGAVSTSKLFVDGAQQCLAPTVLISGGKSYVVFDLVSIPVPISLGVHTVEVKAFIGAAPTQSVQFVLQQASDMILYDMQAGLNIAVSGVPNSGGIISVVDSRQIDVVLDPTFNTVTNVIGGATNVSIGKWKLTAFGENQKISLIFITPSILNAIPAGTSLSNVSLYYNGSQVGTTQTFTGNALPFQLGSQLIVVPGNPGTLEVRADIKTSAGDRYTSGSITVNPMIIPGQIIGMVTGQVNNTAIGLPTSNSVTIISNGLAVAKNAAYANHAVAANTTNVKIGSFFVQNQSSTESIHVTRIDAGISGSFSVGNMTHLRTSETSGAGGVSIVPQAANSFVVDFILPPGNTKVIDLFADLGTGAGTIIIDMKLTGVWTSSNLIEVSPLVVGQTITVY